MTSADDTSPSGATGIGSRLRVARLIAVVLAIAAFTYSLGNILATDPGDAQLAGDQASFVLNALSLQGGDLSYNAADQARWAELGWDPQPRGLFVQRNDHGWAVAKPIGYSVVLAPALALFGHRGVTVTGAFLLVLYALGWYLACRLRWSRSTSVVTAVVASVFSYAAFYAYPAHADLFVAVLTGTVAVGVAYARVRTDPRAYWVAALAAGLLATEKVPALLALIPLLVVGARRLRRRDAIVGVGLLALSIGASVAPYLYYSDGQSWSAYGGERYYVTTVTPWSGGTIDDLLRTGTDEILTPSYAFDRVTDPSPDIPAAALTYVIGRHTGVMTFIPIIPLLVSASAVAGVVDLRRRRRPTVDGEVHDSHDDAPQAITDVDRPAAAATEGEHPPMVAGDRRPEVEIDLRGHHRPVGDLLIASTASLMLYAAFYLVLFTSNYYGGGQSIGSRYFLQFSLVAAIVPVAAGVSARAVWIAAACSVVWSLVVLPQHYDRPDRAFVELWKTSTVQRWLPYETTQKYHDGLW